MSSKTIKIPGPDHPITIEKSGRQIDVRVGDKLIARSSNSLVLKEAAYPEVFYIPRADVDMTLLVRTEHESYCPFKGDCNYFSIPLGGEKSVDAVWTYEAPYPAVAGIKDYLAFYPSRVDAITQETI